MTSPQKGLTAEQVRAIEALGQKLATTLRAIFSDLGEAMRPFAEYVREHPELIDQLRQEREAQARVSSCHCLCQLAHGSLGVCTGEAEPGLTVTYAAHTVGTQRVPFCRPCFEARARSVTA